MIKRKLIRAIPGHAYEILITYKDGSTKTDILPIEKTKMRVSRGIVHEIYLGGSWWCATEEEYNAHDQV